MLIEAFDAADIAVAAQLLAARMRGGSAPLLVGVNSRDLVTLKVVPGRLEELVALLPRRRAARGRERRGARADDAARLARAGYDLALIGSALMTRADPLRWCAP